MTNKIIIGSPKVRGYGKEYPVKFYRNDKLVHEMVVFPEDLKYINNAYTQDFNNVKPIRKTK